MAKWFFRSGGKPKPMLSGAMLMSDFQSAMTNLSTAMTARYVAEQSEQSTLQTISAAAPHNNVYVTPDDLQPEQQAELVRASLNAHLQKAQSEQIAQFTDQQLAEMEMADRQNYAGKKVKVIVVDREFKPLVSVWQDKRTGQVRQGIIKSKTITGIIDDIAFKKNLIVLRPSFKSRIFLPERKFILVYPVNPETLMPATQLELN